MWRDELRADSQLITAAPYMKAGSSIISVGRGMDISKLPKGSYRLDVQATDSTGEHRLALGKFHGRKVVFAPRFLCLKDGHFNPQEFFGILPEIPD